MNLFEYDRENNVVPAELMEQAQSGRHVNE